MPLAITSRFLADVVIVDVAGRMSFLDVTLSDRMKEWLKDGHRAFVLNLADVPYVDSFGLGQLITILNSIRSKGGRLILLRPTDHLRTLLQITKLNSVFKIATEESHAVGSVRTKGVERGLYAVSSKSNLP